MAGFQDSLERIRAASDIVDVIGGYLPLKRAGANFTTLCPFHKEKTPSFNVNPSKQIFHCFGCQKGGDVFTFIQEYESIGFMDAVRRLADRAKIPLEFDATPGAKEARHIKDQLLQVHEQITQRWQNALANEANGQTARDYLARRGVSTEAIKLFRLGAAPDAWDDTVNWARNKGHDLALLERAGLIIRREGAEGYYDRFRGRLMFPICDEQGRVIGFSGRVLSGDEKTAKYVNSPETPIFTKSKVFFGLDKSKRAILDAGFAVVCEGQLDLIASFMGGVQNVVAPQGTAFTEQHARILKRYVDEVVLCFDSDNAGQNAVVRSLDHLLGSGLAVRVAVVPAPHDPDSYIKANGGEAFRRLVGGAEGFFDYYLTRLCATNDISSDRGRLAVLDAMAEALQKANNSVLLDTYAQKTALRLGVKADSVRVEFGKAVRRHADSSKAAVAIEEELESPKRPTPLELGLLHLLFSDDALVAWTNDHLDPAWIGHDTVRSMVTNRLTAESARNWVSLSNYLSSLPELDRDLLSGALTMNYWEIRATGDQQRTNMDHKRGRQIPNPTAELAGVVKELRNAAIESKVREIDKRLVEIAVGSEESIQLQQHRAALQKAKRQPLSPLADQH